MNVRDDAKADGNSIRELMPVSAILVALVALFLGTQALANGTMENDGYLRILTLPLTAALAACVGRVLAVTELGLPSRFKIALSSLFFVTVSAIPEFAPEVIEIESLVSFTFAIVGICSLLLVNSNRREEANLFLVTVIGFYLSVSLAATTEFGTGSWAGTDAEMIDAIRSAAASLLFAFWASSISLGLIMTVAMRGTLDKPGKGSLFSTIPSFDTTNSSSRYTMSVLGLILAIQLIPLVWLCSITGDTIVVDGEAISNALLKYSGHEYLGSVWALMTSLVIFCWAFCRSERWQVIAALIAVNWILYSAARLVEIGNPLGIDILPAGSGDSTSAAAWFFLIFWSNVAAYILSVRGYFGDTAPLREHSALRVWWNTNYYGIMIAMALFVSLAIRAGWNVLPAMNASGTQLWDMTGGSDPWYMKRVIDYVVAERSHFIFDSDRSYPMGVINPRPPLFSWSLALGGIGLNWLTDSSGDQMVWWSVSAMPAVYGALIVLPLAGIARRVHSNLAGVITAWLIALMPGHIGHSTFALADHDSFALLFISMAFYFWVRAVEEIRDERLFNETSMNPLYLIAGIREMWLRSPMVMSCATLSGISFATVALGWKGFVYGPGILFLAFSTQAVLNLFRNRDSLPITAAALQMLFTAFLIPLPFYIWPGLDLLFDPSGFQPMFYIIGFTIALGWVTCSFRDKPWLLVIASGTALFGAILLTLAILQAMEYYNGWDVLFTGGFYFSKNKIFGTIGEAQAPSRGVLFASYGPIVSIIAISCAVYLIWRGARRNRQSDLLLGSWTIVAAYMAWSAGRFIFNATPAMAVVGGLGIAMLWNSANPVDYLKEYRRSGIGNPSARRRSTFTASRRHPGIPALILVFLLVASQHATYGIDSGIPRGEEAATDVDQTIYEIAPDFLRWSIGDFSILDDEEYDPESGMLRYMGTFGPGFNGADWNTAYQWLSEQDSDVGFSQRPAFVSWWDYGFQALSQGQHPTVADNFQSGIPHSGAMLLSQGQDDTLAMFITTLTQGDMRSNSGVMTTDFVSILEPYMSEDQISEFQTIMSIGVGDSDVVMHRSMQVVANDGAVDLLRGYQLDENGIPSLNETWMVYFDGSPYSEGSNESTAKSAYDVARGRDGAYVEETTHYMIGNYRYTKDLIDDFDDVSTGLHRQNSKLGMARAFLVEAFEMHEMVDLYHQITTEVFYDVQDYEGGLGETTERNNDIRYFAVDNRLYPLGGSYYADYNYHRGQTTGIFHAPTGLSGLDLDDYISTMYQTQRGVDGTIVLRTADEYEQEYLNDIVRQQSGAAADSSEMIQMVDIDYNHQAAFFETMVARTYVGYGSSSLGLPGDAAQPAPHFYMYGTPGSYMEPGIPLPGAMMNHMVLANWYELPCEADEAGDKIDENCVEPSIGSANTQVKILKYYSGATLSGTIELEGIGPVPNARLLIERDAFSGEEVPDEEGFVTDRDSRTYWIPIGTADADENGMFEFIVPAGKIKVTAFFGEPDLESARSSMMTGTYSMTEILNEINLESRDINPVSGILGNVSGATWLTEQIINISGSDGHSNGESVVDISLSVEPSQAIGQLVWSSTDDYNGNAIVGSSVELVPKWEEIVTLPYTATTSNGTVTGENLAFNGIGEVSFSGAGLVQSTSISTITDFTGNFTQEIKHNHTLVGEGVFDGRGTLSGAIDFQSDQETQILDCGENDTMPDNESYCELSAGDFLIEGIVNASGRFTSNGSTEFTQRLSHASLVASGIFEVDTSEDLEHYGTINGTGLFSGDGTFSGPMVQAGTFHVMDMIPGTYSITAVLNDGTRVQLDDDFIVTASATTQIQKIDIAGSVISGKLISDSGVVLDSYAALLDESSEFSDATQDCSVTGHVPCRMYPDLVGDYGFGPLPPGNYSVLVDLDEDGFYEESEDYVFDLDAFSNVIVPSPIPQKFDLHFEMMNDGAIVPDLEITISPKDGVLDPVSAQYSSEDEAYHVELSPGEWVLDYALSNTEQVWEEFEIYSDLNSQFEFVTSVEVSGIVYYEENTSAIFNPDENKTISSDTIINFYWDGFSTSAMTNESGEFTVFLPEGAEVDATVEGSVAGLVNGTKFTVIEGMEDVLMVATPGTDVFGLVSILRANNFYTTELVGWEQLTVTAQNDNYDVTWRKTVDSLGKFQMVLPNGDWTFDIVDSDIDVSPVTKSIDSDNFSVEMILSPPNGTLSLEMFMDNSGDLNSSNGTHVSYDFEIVSTLQAGMGKNVTYDGSEWVSEGLAEVSLEPGSYNVIVTISDATDGDLFGTMLSTEILPFDISLQGDIVERSAVFLPEWRVQITLANQFGGMLSNEEFRLTNSETGWTQTQSTDDAGIWVDHLSQGEWILIIDSLENSEGVTENLRATIDSSSQTAPSNLSFYTLEAASVIVNLMDQSGELLQGMELTATSEEGLGSLDLPSSDASGSISTMLFPGEWAISLNSEEGGIKRTIESTSVTLASGDNGELNFTAEMSVEVNGNVFWDLNDNAVYNIGEGVSDASVEIYSSDCDSIELVTTPEAITIVTDSSGSYSEYLPVDSNYCIEVSAEGFESYSQDTDLGESPVETDLQMVAEMVQVGGHISYIDGEQFSLISDSVVLELIPTDNYVRDSIVPVKTIADGSWTGNWSASVEPGEWIIRATSEDQGLVAMSLVTATVVEGGYSDMDMVSGGWAIIETQWFNYEGESMTLSDIDDAKLTLNMGAGVSWIANLDEDGSIRTLLQGGVIDVSSEFTTLQRGFNMSYSGGQAIGVQAGQETPIITVSHSRIPFREIALSVLEGTGGDTSHSAGPDDLLAVADNDTMGFNSLEFTLSAVYSGHEPLDTFSAQASVPGTDGGQWLVEFHNGSEEWNTSMTFEMGLDNVQSLSDLHVRVTPPNQSVAHSLQGGHSITLSFFTSGGYFEETSVKVRIPQIHGFSVVSLDPLYGISPGEEIQIPMEIKNDGNGDDRFEFEFDDSELPEGWERTGSTSHTVPPFTTTTHTISVMAPDNATGDYTVYASVSDKSGNVYPDIEINVSVSNPVVSITSQELLFGGENAVAGRVNSWVVTVANDGLVDATGVQLNATLCTSLTCTSEIITYTQTGDVPANSEVNFDIMLDLGGIDPGNYYLNLEINESSVEGIVLPFEPNQGGSVNLVVSSPAIDTDSSWIGFVLGGLIIGALVMLTRPRSRRPNAPF